MSRIALLALAATLIGGCRTAADGEPPGSLSESIAGTEARRDDRTSKGAPGPGVAPKSKLARSLIAVATVSPADAQPCEQVCGRLGDCLLADDAYTSVVAGGLELDCLDLCVHAPDDAAAKREFLACGSEAECGQLQSCAAHSWASLGEVHRQPPTGDAVAPTNACKVFCRWMYGCSYGGTPPSGGSYAPHVESEIEMCTNSCEQGPASEREMWAVLATCIDAISDCSWEHVDQCVQASGGY
ncbi:MAG: hypothetical protein R6X02_12935 [Enhygromyxa sp.]